MDANDRLLPEGIYDLLPPMARGRNLLMQRLLDRFDAKGYAQVNPPLVEFEDAMLSGKRAALAAQTFRVMDPLSQRMLAFRPDMTLQVARIAATQMAAAPRPLRLCYAGTTLLASGDPLQPGRQKTQAGIELFGQDAPEADAEIIALAVEALRALVPGDICVDLMLPGLVESVLGETGAAEEEKRRIREAVTRKDAAGLAALPEPQRTLLKSLIESAGGAEHALAAIGRLALPSGAAAQIAHLHAVTKRLSGMALTVDPAETRGFEYHHLLSFSLFSRAMPQELGRGGRYQLDNGEPAVGCTLYVDTLLKGTGQ